MESSQKTETESESQSDSEYLLSNPSTTLESSNLSSEPSSSQQSSSQLFSSDPSSTQLSSSQPSSSQPFSSQPSSSQPFSPEPSSSQPFSPEPSSSQPAITPSLEEPSLTSTDIPSETTTEGTISTQEPTPVVSTPVDTELNLYDQSQEQSSEEQYQQQPEEQYQQPEEQQEQQQPEEQQEQYQQPEEQQQQQPEEQQEQQQTPEEQQQTEEQIPQEITQEELQELQERELSLRSKVLNQPLPCKKKQTAPTTYIEKIQVKTPLTDNEVTISRQIKEQCKQAFLYFQPLVETTPLQVNTITECEDNSTPPESTPTDEVIETKYKKTATQPLTQFLEAHIATPKQKNKFIQLLVHTHIQLLHAIQTLQKLDPPIIHFHLTPETLLYNTIDATPTITDFRLAFTKPTLENPEENKELFPPYENIPQYPFEVFLLSKLQDDTPLDASSLAPIAEAFAQQTNLSLPSITPYETLAPKDIRTKAIAHHLTWDPYAVHHYIYSFMTNHQIPTDRPFMTQYKDFLVSYLTSTPDQRPSIETTRENITNIFKSVPKKDYLGFLDSLQQHWK
jgi:hypothetical protein